MHLLSSRSDTPFMGSRGGTLYSRPMPGVGPRLFSWSEATVLLRVLILALILVGHGCRLILLMTCLLMSLLKYGEQFIMS